MNKPLQGIDVLLVEDDVDSRELVEEVFQSAGAVVRTAGSIAETLTILETWEPAILLTDISLPDGDGYALLARARAVRPEVPAIAITGYTAESDRNRAREAGFQEHVAKPVDLDELVAAVVRVAARPA